MILTLEGAMKFENGLPDPFKNRTFGERTSDRLTEIGGSWRFIFCFLSFLLVWVVINLFPFKWDPYPFILLNLFLSCLAAIQAPVIMMSQNRQAARDRMVLERDYRSDLRSEDLLKELNLKVDVLMKDRLNG